MSLFKVIPFPSSIDLFSGRPMLGVKCSLQIEAPKADRKLVDRVRERITNGKVEMSPSAYDTAWVAMVPSRVYSGKPCFPECLEWIKENQNPNGSWGPDPGHPFLVKDSLSCTLACLLALRKWNAGNQLVQRGLEFMESNIWAATHDHDQILQLPPIGFEIVFPAMIDYAKELDLTLPFNPTSLLPLLNLRDSELRKGKWEYVAEGVVGEDSRKWKKIISNHQRRNGSLFNSPATTAAVLIHTHDHKCFHYLLSVLQYSNGSVLTMYPMDIYARLCMIDTLERLGIDRYFGVELNPIFEDIYRNWEERDEQIFSNVTCLALAFRLLRVKGYDVSSDELAEFVEEEGFLNGVSMEQRGVGTVLELYRASHIRMKQEEIILDKIDAWTKPFLKHQLLNRSIRDKRLEKQVEYDLKNLYGALDRFQHRRTLDSYDHKSSQMAKTSYRLSAVYNNEYIFHLAAEDFKISRAEYLKELEQINKWYSDCRLDLLTKGRNSSRETYILTAALVIDHHQSMARMVFAKVAILVATFDDFFDHYGSKEEAFDMIHLIKEWKLADSYSSKEVEILFTALYHTINDVAAKAHAEQGFCSKQQLINLWVDLEESAVRGKDSLSGRNMTSLEEYLSFAPTSIGCIICVMSSVHFLGVKLSEEIWTSEELSSLCKHASVVCRLLNDLKSYEREREEETLNSVSVQMVRGGVSEEEAMAKAEEVMEYHRRKVMEVVYGGKGSSSIPRECKELLWKTCKLAHCLYDHDGSDEFSSPKDILKDINSMMFEPLP